MFKIRINFVPHYFPGIRYVVNLRETQQTSKLDINSLKINVNDIVQVFYEKVPKHFSRIILANRPALRGTRTHFDRCPAVCPHQRNVPHFQKSFKIFPHLPAFPVS